MIKQTFKVNGQLIQNIEWKQTDGRTDGWRQLHYLTHAVGNKTKTYSIVKHSVRSTHTQLSVAINFAENNDAVYTTHGCANQRVGL